MTRAAASTWVWALLVLVAAGIAARARYTTDLSAFLPRRADPTQQLLVEQLREGPAAHLILAAIEGGDARTRAQVSAQLAARLEADSPFLAVSNGEAAQLQRDRDFLFAHRYLLSTTVTPERFSAAGLREAIAGSLDLLASPEGLLVKPLFTRDPTGEMLGIVESLDASHAPHTSAGVWSSPDGSRALLLLETRAAGSDTDGQQAACEALRSAYATVVASLPPAARAGLKLRMSGPPVFAVAARATIKDEVVRLSLISAVLIAALLITVYRSLAALALTFVPVASGALAGVAAVALGFRAVHGLTLGFGVTLIGEAVDYSIYLFIQNTADFRSEVWPTIRLGMLTSICGFAALLPSVFPGLAQLGLYSIAGLVAAALVTRYVLPAWRPPGLFARDLTRMGEGLGRLWLRVRRGRALLWGLPCLAGVALLAHRGTVWNRELAALSPIPLEEQELDERLRADTGAPDVRYVVVASARGREDALDAAQALSARLTPLTEAGIIGGFESPSRYLPALDVQRGRQGSLPPPELLAARLKEALASLPVQPERLQPFIADVGQARRAPALSRADLDGTSFARAVDALLIESATGWAALLPVSAAGSGDLSDSAVARVREALAKETRIHAQLLDLKGEADRLYTGYLTEAIELAVAGFAAIVGLLLFALRSPVRLARVVAPLALAVLTVAGALVAAGRELTILNVVGMLLIVAVGSNYALFFDRVSGRPPRGAVAQTLASLLVANLATVTAFGVLACSRVPVLADLGSTVAPGALMALAFAAALAPPALPAAGRP
jgi:predicted exporter